MFVTLDRKETREAFEVNLNLPINELELRAMLKLNILEILHRNKYKTKEPAQELTDYFIGILKGQA